MKKDPFENLSAEERDNLIGGMLGADPMRQVWIVWDYKFTNVAGVERQGRKTVGSLTLSLPEAEEWLKSAKQSRQKWNEAFNEKTCPVFSERDEVKVIEQVWHIRYSETPGSGWVVIEAIRAAGYSVQIKSLLDTWQVIAVNDSETVVRSSLTMAEAACLVAVQVLK